MKNSHKNHREKKLGSFVDFLMEQSLDLRRWSLLIALLLYCLFTWMDFLNFPPELYRITIPTRIVLVILPLIYLTAQFWFNPPKSILTHTKPLLIVYLIAGINHSLIHYYSEMYNIPFSQLGLVLILMFGCLLLVLPVLPAMLVSIIILLVFTASAVFLNYPFLSFIFPLTILCFVAGLCLAINRVCQRVLYENYKLIQALHEDSVTDGLTELYNKRFFDEQIVLLNKVTKRSHEYISLILIDADKFKVINDTYGHQVGDLLLIEIAQILNAKCRRANDFAFRIGGDEFAMLLTGLSKERVSVLCAEIFEEISQIHINQKNKTISGTVSIGAHTKNYNDNIDSDQFFSQADQSLYQAKAAGGNCCHIT